MGNAVQECVISPSEERIQALCSKAVAARDHEEVRPVARELRAALHEHIEEIRERVRILSRCRLFAAGLAASRNPIVCLDRRAESA